MEHPLIVQILHINSNYFGTLLSGKGQIWFDDMTIEIISDIPPSTTIQKEPVNLNFEGE